MVMGLPRTMVLGVVLLAAAPAVAVLRRGKHRHVPVPAGIPLSRYNSTPLRPSRLVIGARWTSVRYDPPKNQQGDILPTIWADDNRQYTLMDDGGTDIPANGPLWRQSLARISGAPPKIGFSFVGDPATPAGGWTVDGNDPQAHGGPIGPYYSSGLVEARGIFYATQENDWNWNANGAFTGLMGIAYSRNHGEDWREVNKPFPAPLGNLNWVIRGRGGVYPDGYVYAIASEREFNASTLILGRSRPELSDITDPARWQWLSGWRGEGKGRRPVFSSPLAGALPALRWSSHITYPQMVYDAGIRRYLLTFTYSYISAPPGAWKNGAELVITEAPTPWGPFSFVAQDPDFGPSNGYGASFPIKWISPNGRDLWLKWAANFAGCKAQLDCSGAYGFNYRRIHLTLRGDL